MKIERQIRSVLPSQQGWVAHLTLLSLLLSTIAVRSQDLEEQNLVQLIREKILATSPTETEKAMADYRHEIPETGESYEMIAIKGGEFLMGSPPEETDREPDEGPQRRVSVAPFWMGKFEVTWDQYEPFLLAETRRQTISPSEVREHEIPLHHAVSTPTLPNSYDLSEGMGKGKHPAIGMTQHSASKFCQWLSAQTGHYYRLPTEAEWEYACRAGTNTAYHFGDDPERLEEYAVFDPEFTRTGYAEVGTKKPNPWGLHDMHGNVLEWCLDQYFPDAYRGNRKTIPATTLYPRVVRGGSWYDTAEFLRSAARMTSHLDWKIQDPQRPPSIWHFTDASWLGFRIVRPLALPTVDEMHQLWNSSAGLTDPR